LARANRRQCDDLLAALGALRVSVRDMAALYDGWRRADATGRQRLVADPALYLKAHRAAVLAPTAEGGELQALLKDLGVLGAIAARAHQRLQRRDRLALDQAYRRTDVAAAWRVTDASFTTLRTAFEEWTTDAGPEPKDDDPRAA
jgi:hypothetical protein